MCSLLRIVLVFFLLFLGGTFSGFSQTDKAVEALLKEGHSIYKKTPEKAIELAHQARAKGDTKQKALAGQLLLRAFERTGQIDSAVYYGTESIALAKSLNSPKREAKFLEKLARLYRNTGEPAKALGLYGEALTIFETLVDSSGIAFTENSIGISHKKMGNYAEAVSHYNRSKAIRVLMGDTNRVAQTINNIGNVYRLQGKLDSALSKYMVALSVFEALNDSTNMTNALNNIGLIHNMNGNQDLALKYYFRVQEIRTLKGDQRGLQAVRNNIATIYRKQGMRDSALALFNQIYDYAWSHGLKDYEALALHNSASIYMDDSLWSKAITGFKSSLAIRTELKDRWGVASCNQNLGECYFRMGAYRKAIPYAEKSLDQSTEIGSAIQIETSLKMLHKSYAKLGVYDKAYAYQELRKAVTDSLRAVERATSISEMQAKYENEKTLQQIELANQRNELQEERIARQLSTRNYLYLIIGLSLLVVIVYVQRTRKLRKTNEELTVQKEELDKRSQEKEMLLNEIHHRVKNNLQVVSSLLNMQSREVKDEKVLKALKEGRDRVHSMALVHQMFYQEHEDTASIEAHKYIEKLCNSLIRSYRGEDGGIKLNLDVEECLLDIDRATLIGLIANELVSNSLKYAFENKNEGELSVSLKPVNDKFELTVSDNGKGKTKKSSDGSSFGLKLVTSMTKKLKGTLTTVTEGGYSTKIVFPKTK